MLSGEGEAAILLPSLPRRGDGIEAATYRRGHHVLVVVGSATVLVSRVRRHWDCLGTEVTERKTQLNRSTEYETIKLVDLGSWDQVLGKLTSTGPVIIYPPRVHVGKLEVALLLFVFSSIETLLKWSHNTQ